MKHPLHIVRPLNLSIIASTMLVILYKYRDELADDYWLRAALLILPAVLTAAAGYVVNDIFDVQTDAINKPESCIVGVRMSRKNAWLLYAVLSVLSLLFSYLFSSQYAVINTCIIAMLYLYAAQLKGTPLIGNILVAMCSAAVIACSVLLIAFDTKAAIMNFTGYTVFAFFISLIREIVKDMQDIEGDSSVGLRTYPVVAGIKGAKIMVYVLCGLEIILCGTYSFISWGLDLYVSSVIMGLITLGLLYFINHMAVSKSKTDFGTSSRLLKYIMFAGVVNLIFA